MTRECWALYPLQDSIVVIIHRVTTLFSQFFSEILFAFPCGQVLGRGRFNFQITFTLGPKNIHTQIYKNSCQIPLLCHLFPMFSETVERSSQAYQVQKMISGSNFSGSHLNLLGNFQFGFWLDRSLFFCLLLVFLVDFFVAICFGFTSRNFCCFQWKSRFGYLLIHVTRI